MNGRIYDPLLGRFLSADLTVQAPGNLQAYNRYSYVMNNPLSLVDPSGFIFGTPLSFREFASAVVSGAGSGAAGYAQGLAQGAAGAVTGTVQAVAHPFDTAKATADGLGTLAGRAIYDTSGLANDAKNAAVATVSDPTKLGNAVGNFVTGTAIGVGAAKGLSAVGEIASVAAKTENVVAKTEAAIGTAEKQLTKGSVEVVKQAEVQSSTSVASEAGACFTAGTLIRSGEGFVEIETIKVGERVATGSASNETAVDPQTYRLVTLRIKGQGDDVFEIICLRPLQWVNENHIEPGAKVRFVVGEMGIDGIADVLALTSCPTISKGSGRVVLMTVTHLYPAVMQLTLTGLSAPLEPTASHRLFSADRNDWVQAQELHTGEHLKTANGVVELLAISQKPGVHRVYNVEVETEHKYLVSKLQVVSHNSCAASGPPPAQRTNFHGNDARNPNPQHNYSILKEGEVRKTGVGTGEATDGVSARAESQLQPGETYRIDATHPAGEGARGKAYVKEKELAKKYYEDEEPMDRHKRPKP